MRGTDARSGELFSYVDLEQRVPAKHPLRLVRRVGERRAGCARRGLCEGVRAGWSSLDPPEGLLRALLLQAFYTIRSERQLMEQLD